MKLFISYFWRSTAMALLVLATDAAQHAGAADSSACYTINDADARSYCIARARKDTGACYTIQRADLRSACLAEVRR